MSLILPSIGSGIIASPTAPPSWNGNTYSLSLDGSNDYIDCGTVSALNSASTFSVSAWYKKASASGGGLIVGVGPFPGERFYIEHFSNNTIYVGYDSTFASVSSTADTNWHHVVYVRDSGTHKLYLDGNDMSLGGTPSSTTGASAGNPFYIGRLNNYSGYFGGLIDEVAVYSSALSSSDVTAIYNSGEPTDLSSYSPVHWWRNGDNDSGSGTTITDQGSGGNDGTLINGPTFSTDVPLGPLVLPSITNTYSVDFDGTNDYMDFGTNTTINSSSAFSVSAWFDVDNISTTFPTICLLKTNLTKGFVISLSNTTGGNAIYNGVWFGSAYNEFRGYATNNSTLSASLVSGFHHLILTYDGVDPLSSSSFTIYVDGVNYAIRSTSVGLGSYANANHVAKGAYQFDGLIDEFAIFNTELTQREVTGIYNSGTPNDISSLNPVGWWRMGDNNSGSGTTITDQGSGGNDGTLTNGPTFSTTVP
jgi:hypothetical protein